MIIETISGITRITADPGKTLTNGVYSSEQVWLGKADKIENWHEIDKPEDDGEPATAEDYEAALNKLGVEV